MPDRIGVLLVQLGTPDAPTPRALRRYLREFLGDPRVLDLPVLQRWLLLYGVILPFRPRISAALYRRIWTPEGSPLLVTSMAQSRMLQERLGDRFQVELGMRYGRPSLDRALEGLIQGGCRRVLLVPLFPQYSSATTGSACEAFFRALSRRRAVPAVRVVAPFGDDPGFVEAVAARAREALGGRLTTIPLLFSFHGLPKRYVEAGDPYPGDCRRTAEALAAALDLGKKRWRIVYQSRFGREEWIRPYVLDEIESHAREIGGDLAVLCPGFIADCLETIDEIGNVAAEAYRAAGGGELRLVPCLNDHPCWIEALEGIVRRECMGWAAAQEATVKP